MTSNYNSSRWTVHVSQIIEPLKLYVQQGAEPKTLARSTGVGLVIGIIPVIGAPHIPPFISPPAYTCSLQC